MLIVRDEKTSEISVVAGLQADGSKVTDHHALLVTGEKPLFLSKEDNTVYQMIAGRMVEAFSDKCVKELTTVTSLSGEVEFAAKGCVIRQAGWRAVRGEESEEQVLPHWKIGDTLAVCGVSLTEGKTKPKPLHTEASLLSAMETAGKDVEDEEVRQAMRECGIGTPATRAAIIETFFARGYVQRCKKSLVPTEKDFSTANRVRFFNNIKNNDYDCVIMSHDQFGKIPQSPELQQRILQAELDSVEESLEVLRAQGKDISRAMLKGLEKRKFNLEAKLQKVEHAISSRTDDVVDFRQMGIDHLFVDESHQFKNLTFNTRHDRVAGLGNSEGSQKALNMLFAIRTIQERTGKDLGATFLSGTTISNSLTELYLLFKYLRPKELERQDIRCFDAWAALSETEEKAKMLIATDYARKMALDMRMIDPAYEDHPDNKASHCAKTIAEYYRKYDVQKGTQFVFSDLGTYQPGDGWNSSSKREQSKLVRSAEREKNRTKFNVYSEIKRKLMEDYGIPGHEVRFIQECKTDKARKAVIAAMNEGSVRVLFGSTSMLGTGVNAQRRCVAILSGNTDLLEKAKLEKRIASLEGERKSFNKGRRESEFKLESRTSELRNNQAVIAAMTEDWEKFTATAKTDKEGNRLNALRIEGVDSTDEKVLGKHLQEIAKNAVTGGIYQPVGELYGFPVKVVSERVFKEGLEFTDNRFVVEGNYKYTYKNGHLAMADPIAAARNFLNALERIPSMVEQYKEKNKAQERDIPQLQEIVGKVWKKEDELKQLKSELAALDRKIQLELAPPAPEVKQQEEKPDGEIHNLPNKTIDIRPEQNEQIYGRREIAEPVRRIRLG